MSQMLREGAIVWAQDLNASTSTTAFPTTSTQGVAWPTTLNRRAGRIHVGVRHSVASGTVSLMVQLYGYSAVGDFSAGGWFYLGGFNSGSSMAVDGSKWSPDSSTINVAETFTASTENYSRYYTRQIAPGGSSPTTTTYIGFPTE